ncbi:MAG: HEPN domain-containing protein [archaeon]
MARETRKEESEKFMKKAEEFYSSALENYQKQRYNASAFDSSQAIILSNDAFCIYSIGKRPSKDHREAVLLHVEASASKENKKEVIKEALEKRGEFGYTEKETTVKDANMLLIRARRFLDWTKSRNE